MTNTQKPTCRFLALSVVLALLLNFVASSPLLGEDGGAPDATEIPAAETPANDEGAEDAGNAESTDALDGADGLADLPAPEMDGPLEAEVSFIDSIEPFRKGRLLERALDETDYLVAESDTHELYFSEETLALKCRDKEDGYIWSSNVPREEMEHLSGVWQTFMSSPIVVEYKDLNRPSTTTREYPELVSTRKIDDGFAARFRYPAISMSLEAEFSLEGASVHVDIQDDSFEYEAGDERQFELSGILILPFWGAVRAEATEGYLFIPDGPGALMRFGEVKPFRSPYLARVYGRDEGISRIGQDYFTAIPQVPTEGIHMPVYGISHGHRQQACLATIENGAEFADILASPAGVRIDFYWSSAVFNYLETYYQPTGRAGKTFPYIYTTPNPVNPHVSFHLLREDEASYVGMAQKYRDFLEAEGRLPQASPYLDQARDFPLLIHALMSEQESALFFTKLVDMTSIGDLVDWSGKLLDLAGNGLVYSLHGAQKDGLSGHELGDIRVSRRAGGEKALQELMDLADEEDFDVLLNTDLAVGNEVQLPKRYMLYNVDRDVTWRFTQRPLYDKEYFLNLEGQTHYVEQLRNTEELTGHLGLDLSSIGYTLFSNYKDGDLTDRRYTRETIQAALEDLSQTRTLFLDRAHDYLWFASDALYNVPRQHSQYVYETDTVPFMQIALGGSLPMFASYINYGTQEHTTLLSLMDYGLYPSFLVTQKPASELMNSNTQDIYFSEFDSLFPDIEASYTQLKAVLDPVRGERIIDREIPVTDISITSYENGMDVVTNYSARDYVYEGTTVPAFTAVLIEH